MTGNQSLPLVTIITPAYNCQNHIGETMKSVIEQTYENWEHLVIDDCSKDETRQMILLYAQMDLRIKPIFMDSNAGVAHARNTGILMAQGKYIAFLDGDDLWKRDKLAKQIGFMEQNHYRFTYSDYDTIDGQGNYIKSIRPKKSRIDYKELLYSNQIACLTVIIDSSVMKKALMPRIGHEDFATWLNILKTQVDFAYKYDGVLASYRKLKGSLSANKLKALTWTWHIYRSNQNMGILNSLVHITGFIGAAIIKYMRR